MMSEPEVSGWELLEEAAEGATADFSAGVAVLLDGYHGLLLTLPAAGSPTDPTTWTAPADPYWGPVLLLYTVLSAFVLPLVWAVGWFRVGVPQGVRRRERLESAVWAVVLVLAGWVLLQGWLHWWNTAALAFSPPVEFLRGPGVSADRLGVGVVLGLVMVAGEALILLLGLVFQLCLVFLTYGFVAIWPVAVGLHLSGVIGVDGLGTAGMAAALLLPPVAFMRAVALRFVFEFAPSGPPAAAAFSLLVALALAYVIVPYVGLTRLLPRAGGWV